MLGVKNHLMWKDAKGSLLVSSWCLLLMLSAPSASLSLTVQTSISGNCVTPAQQPHWKVGDENNLANNRRGQLLLDDANLHMV